MPAFAIVITRFISSHQPGFVEGRFYDAWGQEHIVEDKVPVICIDNLDAGSKYPASGQIACMVAREWTDANGRAIVTVRTEQPWDIVTVAGNTEFDLLPEQLLTDGLL